MSAIRCLDCGAETTNGLALCEGHQDFASRCLEWLPVYFKNLSRWRRPARPNGSLGASGQWLIQRGESEGSRIATALEHVANDLDTRARMLTDDRGILPEPGETDAETVEALCMFLDVHLTSIATLDWAGDLVRDLRRHEDMLRLLTETAVPGWYSGACQRVTGRDMEGNIYRCGAATYVVPGLTWVTCTGCGLTTYARDHLDVVLEEASDWIARPMRLAEAIVALVDTEQSVARLHKRISKWGERGPDRGGVCTVRRKDADGDEVGPKMFRFGDVMERLLSEGPTRLERVAAQAV